jgi:hypothetical protein
MPPDLCPAITSFDNLIIINNLRDYQSQKRRRSMGTKIETVDEGRNAS